MGPVQLVLAAPAIAQQWYANPTIEVMGKVSPAAQACLIDSIKKQDVNMANENRVTLLTYMTREDATTKVAKRVEIPYCSIGDAGYAKRCAAISIVTADPKGFKYVGQSGTAYVVQAASMGRFADCRTYFGVK